MFSCPEHANDQQVRMKGLEPPRLTAQDPKSCAATNYATSAAKFCAKIPLFNFHENKKWIYIGNLSPIGVKKIIKIVEILSSGLLVFWSSGPRSHKVFVSVQRFDQSTVGCFVLCIQGKE